MSVDLNELKKLSLRLIVERTSLIETMAAVPETERLSSELTPEIGRGFGRGGSRCARNRCPRAALGVGLITGVEPRLRPLVEHCRYAQIEAGAM